MALGRLPSILIISSSMQLSQKKRYAKYRTTSTGSSRVYMPCGQGERQCAHFYRGDADEGAGVHRRWLEPQFHPINAFQTMSVIPSRKRGCGREGRVKTRDTGNERDELVTARRRSATVKEVGHGLHSGLRIARIQRPSRCKCRMV
jgi:hypothetical protein